MKSSRTHYATYLVVNLINVPLYMIAYYFLKNIQIPQLFSKNKFVLFGLSLIASSFVLYLVWRVNGILWIDKLRGYKTITFMSMVDYMTQSVQFYSPAMALLAWDSFYERQQEQARIHQLEKEKLNTELKFLKAQLNPHFLFNTLNNLYSFVVNGSPKAPDIILKLSGILDYVLYKSQKAFVPLVEEVEAIENFIALEQVRYGPRLEIEFNRSEALNASISPLLLLSVVENAFKHGASGDIDNPRIIIEINDNGESINCKVWNTKSAFIGEINDEYKEGIGLTNIKRQLDLVYPGRYNFDIEDTDDSFSISLQIPIEHD
ncbi:sensor histidine kinase [Portibacter lacus]|nr:histidine kinase [Portibacter lacus]